MVLSRGMFGYFFANCQGRRIKKQEEKQEEK